MSIPRSGPDWPLIYKFFSFLIGYAALIITLHQFGEIKWLWISFGVTSFILIKLFNKESGSPNSMGMDTFGGTFSAIILFCYTLLLMLISVASEYVSISVG